MADIVEGGCLVDRKQASNVTTGLLLIVIGLILFGDELDLAWSWDMSRLWPLILVAVGAGNLLTPEKRGFGVWMLFIGGVFLLHTHRVVSVRDSWPLFVVGLGAALLVGALSRPRAGKVDGPEGGAA